MPARDQLDHLWQIMSILGMMTAFLWSWITGRLWLAWIGVSLGIGWLLLLVDHILPYRSSSLKELSQHYLIVPVMAWRAWMLTDVLVGGLSWSLLPMTVLALGTWSATGWRSPAHRRRGQQRVGWRWLLFVLFLVARGVGWARVWHINHLFLYVSGGGIWLVVSMLGTWYRYWWKSLIYSPEVWWWVLWLGCIGVRQWVGSF